jgi:hypothetical protein
MTPSKTVGAPPDEHISGCKLAAYMQPQETLRGVSGVGQRTAFGKLTKSHELSWKLRSVGS